MTAIVFKCPNCDEMIFHEAAIDLSGKWKFHSDLVPVTVAHAISGDEMECDRCRNIFTITVPDVAEYTEVILTPVVDENITTNGFVFNPNF